MIGLTHKQAELFEFIKGYVTENGVGPNFDEMMAGVNLKSKSGVHRILTALEERHLIDRLPGRARSIGVIQDSERAAKLDFLSHDLKDVVFRTATANGIFPEVLVASIIRAWVSAKQNRVSA